MFHTIAHVRVQDLQLQSPFPRFFCFIAFCGVSRQGQGEFKNTAFFSNKKFMSKTNYKKNLFFYWVFGCFMAMPFNGKGQRGVQKKQALVLLWSSGIRNNPPRPRRGPWFLFF
jgi:hypothetical protein